MENQKKKIHAKNPEKKNVQNGISGINHNGSNPPPVHFLSRPGLSLNNLHLFHTGPKIIVVEKISCSGNWVTHHPLPPTHQ
jgi:hypothetical protein